MNGCVGIVRGPKPNDPSRFIVDFELICYGEKVGAFKPTNLKFSGTLDSDAQFRKDLEEVGLAIDDWNYDDSSDEDLPQLGSLKLDVCHILRN